MNTLHVMLPAFARSGDDAAWRAWLARGNRLVDLPGARDASLRALFRFAGNALPVAALRHHVHAEDAGLGSWLAADPAYVRSEATGARLMAWPISDLSADDAAQLASALRPLCGDSGTPLSVDSARAWCLHLAEDTPVAEFTRPADALGVDMLECLPRGDAGRAWRRLFNEIQVTLHAHPVNAARTAAGKLPVNALWLWGQGALPGSIDTRLQAVTSNDDVLRGLAKVVDIACNAVPTPALDMFGDAGDALLDLDSPEGSDAGMWLPCFRQWLRKRRFVAIELAFADGVRFQVRHAHRLRFWRRGLK